VSLLDRIVTNALGWPAWLRPVALGAALAAAATLVRLLLVLPSRKSSGSLLLLAAGTVVMAAAGGAIAGLVYMLVRRPLLAIPAIGRHLLGTACVLAFGAVIIVAEWVATGHSLISNGTDVLAYCLLAVLFGSALGHNAFADEDQ